MMRKVQNRFGLTKAPFRKDIPVDEFFDYPACEVALNRLTAALNARVSAVMTGDPGTGKTFILRRLEASLPAGSFRLTYIHNATVSRWDFYRQLSGALGLEPKATPSAIFRAVSSHMEELATHKIHPVVLLDEAHLLPLPVLEQFHILLNFHKDSKPYLSLVLVGLPELRDRLQRNVLQSLAARLPVRVHTTGLSAKTLGDYLAHRMRMAGCTQEVFCEDAILLMNEATGGVLRKADVLANAALEVVASKAKGTLVDASVIEEATQQCAEVLV